MGTFLGIAKGLPKEGGKTAMGKSYLEQGGKKI